MHPNYRFQRKQPVMYIPAYLLNEDATALLLNSAAEIGKVSSQSVDGKLVHIKFEPELTVLGWEEATPKVCNIETVIVIKPETYLEILAYRTKEVPNEENSDGS